MKTSELTGAALNWAVGVAEGIQWESDDPEVGLYHRRSRNDRLVLGALDYDIMEDWGLTPYEPSTNWAQGGPIIEREGFCIQPFKGGWECFVAHRLFEDDHHHSTGPTPLIAAMRCYVASKLGDDIDLPKELT
jgi:hypothetical protein